MRVTVCVPESWSTETFERAVEEFSASDAFTVVRGCLSGVDVGKYVVCPGDSFGFPLDTTGKKEVDDVFPSLIAQNFYGELPVGQSVIVETEAEDVAKKFLIYAPTIRRKDRPADKGSIDTYLAFRGVLVEVGLLERTMRDKNRVSEEPFVVLTPILCISSPSSTSSLSSTLDEVGESCRQMMCALDSVFSVPPVSVREDIDSYLTKQRNTIATSSVFRDCHESVEGHESFVSVEGHEGIESE
jgi:hypothetical protein